METRETIDKRIAALSLPGERQGYIRFTSSDHYSNDSDQPTEYAEWMLVWDPLLEDAFPYVDDLSEPAELLREVNNGHFLLGGKPYDVDWLSASASAVLFERYFREVPHDDDPDASAWRAFSYGRRIAARVRAWLRS